MLLIETVFLRIVLPKNSRPIGRIIVLTLFLLVLVACGRPPNELPRITQPPATIPTGTPVPKPLQEPTPQLSPTPSSSPTQNTPANIEAGTFDGQRSYIYLLDQMAFGPRWPGSPGHVEVGDYIVAKLEGFGWEVEEQRFPYRDIEGRNIIARANIDAGPVIIVGAHYDTRKIADKTPGSEEPVPGAVDGASGVAVLLELAQTLDLDQINNEIWLAFFDVEDQGSGGMPGYDWIVGSSFMANSLNLKPEAMVLVDMVGDADQQLYYEGNSDPTLRQVIWQKAAELGFQDAFIQEQKYSLIDDHLPFARLGIPAIDIIDFDYPYWHTVEDTADKVSPESLHRVGRTLESWLENKDGT